VRPQFPISGEQVATLAPVIASDHR
jgi:hypothetical protein